MVMASESDHRYLVLTELFLPTKGGTAVWFSEVYRRLGGKQIHIVTADVQGADDVDIKHPNSVHRVDIRRISWLRPESLVMYVKLFGHSFWLAIRHRFEAVHAGRALPEGLVGWAVARLVKIPAVIYAHGEELTSWGHGNKYRAMRFVLTHADHVIANSGHTQDQLVQLGVNTNNITLINPGVDIQRFKPDLPCEDLRQEIGLDERQKLMLSVGRLQRRKGFDMVIQALPNIIEQGQDVHYALIGIGDDRDYLLSLADKFKVSDRVHLLGHVEPESLARWYNACDLFVMANREIDGDNEGFGMVYIEAAACKKPSVAGKAGGTASAVVDGETGLRVDGENVENIADALIRLLSDNELASQLGNKGYQRAISSFSWEAVAKKTAYLKIRTV